MGGTWARKPRDLAQCAFFFFFFGDVQTCSCTCVKCLATLIVLVTLKLTADPLVNFVWTINLSVVGVAEEDNLWLAKQILHTGLDVAKGNSWRGTPTYYINWAIIKPHGNKVSNSLIVYSQALW